MILAVQTASGVRLAPYEQVASLTPVRLQRTQVVLADGTVGHRPGPPPQGPWTALGASWVLPRLLVREGECWRDPGGFLYPYQPLEEPEEGEDEEEEGELECCVQSLHRVNRKVFWRTDSGDVPCETAYLPTVAAYDDLLSLGTGVSVNLRRLRALIPGAQTIYLELDTGVRLPAYRNHQLRLARALGCDNFEEIDRSVPRIAYKLRDIPYDLDSAPAERLRADFPSPDLLALMVVWDAVLRPRAFAGSLRDFFARRVEPLLARVGYALTWKYFDAQIFKLHSLGLLRLRELGLAEPALTRRRLGRVRPGDLLIAPYSPAALRQRALAAAQQQGMSSFLYTQTDRLALEYLAEELKRLNPGRLRLFVWGETRIRLRAILESCGLEVASLTRVEDLAELAGLVQAPAPPPAAPPPPPRPLRRLAVQDPEGVVMIPFAQVASLTPVKLESVRVVRSDGAVFYRPGALPEGPWVALQDSRVRPEHLRRQGERWLDPAGFGYPYARLEPAPEVEVAPSDALLYVEATEEGTRTVSDAGVENSALPLALAVEGREGLVQVARERYVQRHRVASTRQHEAKLWVRMDNGEEFRVGLDYFGRELGWALGLTDPGKLLPYPLGFWKLELRDYPYEIAAAPAAVLKRDFHSPRQLIANVIWQTFTTPGLAYGTTFGGFFYLPLQAVLHRAGFLRRAELRKRSAISDRLKRVFWTTIHLMVWRYRFFSYREFGFEDERPGNRLIGKLRPDLLLVVEKGDQLERFGRRLQRQLGCSLHITGGTPKLLDSEYLALDLKAEGVGEVEVLVYGDFDVGGWGVGSGLVKQLKFLGIGCRRRRHVVWPQCFSLEELALYSQPIVTSNTSQAVRLRNWLRQTGGIAGQARSIHANWLKPYERVLARVEEVLAEP